MTSKMLQQLYFPQRSLRQNLLAEDIGDLLDSHTFLSLGVGRRTVTSIRQYISRDRTQHRLKRTRQYRKLLGQAPWSRYISHPQ